MLQDTSWSWRGKEGILAHVEAWSSADSVRFFLNGKNLGTIPVEEGLSKIDVPYEPGLLEAVSILSDGTETGKDALCSAEGVLSISVRPETGHVEPGRLVFVDIDIVGENGVRDSLSDQPLSVSVQGGELLAFGSALPITEESFDSGTYTTYYGHAQAVLRAEKKGRIRIRATGEGLPAGEAVVICR